METADQVSFQVAIPKGDAEMLTRKKEEKKASEPLAPEQFISAFLLLICGILVTGVSRISNLVKNYVEGLFHFTTYHGRLRI